MNGKIRAAFDGIRAEESLKLKTSAYIRSELQKRGAVRRGRTAVIRLAAVTFAVAVIVFTGIFSYNLYFTASAYLDLDVNPSIGLSLNRFGRVIGVYAYNSDGGKLIASLSLKHKKYQTALDNLIEAAAGGGFFESENLVSVTVQSNDTERESRLLSSVKTEVVHAVDAQCPAAQVEIFSVSGETRDCAREQNITPAKYLAILELMDADSSVTFESCKGHSIGEIKRLVSGHKKNHHSQSHH